MTRLPPDGRIVGVRNTFSAFNEPSALISAEVTALTGITDEMVAGHRFDEAAITDFVDGAVIVIAHNSGFDRKFVERYWPVALNSTSPLGNVTTAFGRPDEPQRLMSSLPFGSISSCYTVRNDASIWTTFTIRLYPRCAPGVEAEDANTRSRPSQDVLCGGARRGSINPTSSSVRSPRP